MALINSRKSRISYDSAGNQEDVMTNSPLEGRNIIKLRALWNTYCWHLLRLWLTDCAAVTMTRIFMATAAVCAFAVLGRSILLYKSIINLLHQPYSYQHCFRCLQSQCELAKVKGSYEVFIVSIDMVHVPLPSELTESSISSVRSLLLLTALKAREGWLAMQAF